MLKKAITRKKKSKRNLAAKERTWKVANPGKTIIGDIQDPHVLNAVTALVAAVIKGGLKEEGIEFLKNESLVKWLSISNLSTEYVVKKIKEESSTTNLFINSAGTTIPPADNN